MFLQLQSVFRTNVPSECSVMLRTDSSVVMKVIFSPSYCSEELLTDLQETGVYVDKHGEISKSVVMEFVGNAKKAAVDHQYIMLFSNDFVEIRDLLHGKLCQVIAGQNIRCLDAAEGGFSKRNVLMVMAHPDLEDRQLVLELRLEKLEHSEA